MKGKKKYTKAIKRDAGGQKSIYTQITDTLLAHQLRSASDFFHPPALAAIFPHPYFLSLCALQVFTFPSTSALA